MSRIQTAALTGLMVLAGAGCQMRLGDADGEPARDRAPGADLISFDGTIAFQSFEGGFYGIVAEDGRRFDPIDLPQPFRQDGLAVRVQGEPLDLATIRMWGRPLRIHSIRRR